MVIYICIYCGHKWYDMIYDGHIWYGISMVYGHMVPNMIIIILYTYGMISMIIRYLISCVSYLISYILYHNGK